ncbi:MAG: SprT-like domain-containing protein [Chitinophagaceae bacterium]|nr:SprT-like domain-containing protein [Chitinophagaceae bacterium]
MAYSEHPLQVLHNFLPKNCFDDIIFFLEKYKIHLTIKKDRATVYGDYRPSRGKVPHRISINAGLNEFHFLITLLHEIAHLIVFEKHQHRILPHGIEWKLCFSELLQNFNQKNIFPQDVKQALDIYLKNPKASTCSDPNLLTELKKFDLETSKIMVKDLEIGSQFTTSSGRKFLLKSKRRTRFECIDIENGKLYLFPAIYEVENY